MSAATELARFAAADIRNGIVVMSGFVLGLLLLFFKELTPFCREIVVPTLVVYTIGAALLGHVQILITASENTKAIAKNETPRGIREGHLRTIIIFHILWFIALVSFVSWRGCAQQAESTVPVKAAPSAPSPGR